VNDSALAGDVERVLLGRGAVRWGRHLRVRCPTPGHADTHPSCDVDLERGWICRSCGRGGGLRELAALLGVTALAGPRRPVRTPRVPAPPRGISSADWALAWLDVLERLRRQERRLAPYGDLYAVCDWLRRRRQLVSDARRAASGLGDTPQAWRLLGLAARVMTTTLAVEDELDTLRHNVA
jgi:hypothetical protein